MAMHLRHSFLWAACLCAAACSGSKSETASNENAGGGSAAADASIVRVSQGSDVLSMDPYAHNESPTFCVHRNLFDPLVDFDGNLKPVPCLAEKWENETPTSWIFHLRQGVTFHDGQPFTTDDAIFSLDRALKDPRSRMAPEIQTISGLEAIDDHTLRIKTRVPDAILPFRLASILMMDKESTEAGIAKEGDGFVPSHANGTGPYKLETWRKDERCTLVANDKYWGGAPSVKTLEFIPASNEATRMAAFERGQIDILVNVPTANVDRIAGNSNYNLIEAPGLRLIYLGLDCGRDKSPGIIDPADRNPLKDIRVRRAIAMGIDNKLIVKTIMGGRVQPADQLLPEGETGYDPSIHIERPDYAKAKALLAEAGYPGGFKIRLDGPNDRYVNDARILQAVAQELAKIGVAVTVNAQPKARFFEDERAGNCSFFLIGWSNSNSDGVGTFEHLLHTIDPKENLGVANTSTNYSNKRIDEIVSLAAGEFDSAKREKLLQEANRIAIDELPQIPLHFQTDIYAVSKGIDWKPRRDTQVRGIDIRIAGK